MNVCQKVLFNSFIKETTSAMLTQGSEEAPKGIHIYRHQKCGKHLQEEAKPVNIHRARVNCLPWGTICISVNTNYLRCCFLELTELQKSSKTGRLR